MTREQVKELLEKQLQLLSKQSADYPTYGLVEKSHVVCEIAEVLLRLA